MELFSVAQQFKDSIDQVWNNEIYKHFHFINRGYALQDEVYTNSILFIGINPSYSEKNPNEENKSHFYTIAQQEPSYRYFTPFQEISRQVGINWSHIDLLFIRETDQWKIKDLFSQEKGEVFVNEQLLITKRIIERSKPKVIVVSNAFARDLLYRNFEFEFDENTGTQKIIGKNTELENTPVFFTSMLTGQRALDKGSRERLVWHIKQVLSKSL